MALLAYDPTRMAMVPVSQARVVAYVVDSDTGKQYSTVAQAESDIAANRQTAFAAFRQGERESAPAPTTVAPTQEDVTEQTRIATAQKLAQQAAAPAPTSGMGATSRGEYASSEQAAADRAAQLKADREKAYFEAQAKAKGEKPTPPPADENFTYDYVWQQDVGGPGGKWVLIKTPIFKPSSTGTGSGSGVGSSAGSGTGTGSSASTGSSVSTGPTLAKDVFKNTLALFFGQGELSKPWMDELYNVVSKYYKSGSSAEESLNLSLLDARNNPSLKTFTDRFKGIYALMDLKQAGKPITIPTIAEYVTSQAKMADVLNQANLADLATEDFTTELISKGNSVTTIANKISEVYNRIALAPKDIKDTLSRYFPTVDNTKLARTLLLGEKGLTQLLDELSKYEVLAAAERQGIGAITTPGGVTEQRAQEYARAGGTYASLLPKFAQVREVTPTAAKLAGVSKRKDIGQVGVEQAIISGLAQPMEEIQTLGEEEVARFSGKAGRADTGLASQRRANRAF